MSEGALRRLLMGTREEAEGARRVLNVNDSLARRARAFAAARSLSERGGGVVGGGSRHHQFAGGGGGPMHAVGY